MPRLLLLSGKNSLINCLYRLGSNHCDIIQLGWEFKSALVNSKLQDSLLVLFLKDRIA